MESTGDIPAPQRGARGAAHVASDPTRSAERPASPERAAEILRRIVSIGGAELAKFSNERRLVASGRTPSGVCYTLESLLEQWNVIWLPQDAEDACEVHRAWKGISRNDDDRNVSGVFIGAQRAHDFVPMHVG